MWKNWNFNLPVNHISDSEDDQYESPVEEDPNLLVSPRRPHQSPTASPRALLRPDPPPVEEVLAEVGQQLNELPPRDARAERRNALRRAQEEAEVAEAEAAAEAAAAAAALAAANMPDDQAPVNYDTEEKADGEKAAEYARHIKVEFDRQNIKFWFSQKV